MTHYKQSYDFELIVEKKKSLLKQIASLDRIIIKRWRLRRFAARGENISIAMWDGRQFNIKKGHFRAVYEWNAQYSPDLTPLNIIIKTDSKKKIRICELSEYPNGRADTVKMIEILNAEPSKFMKWSSRLLNVASLFKSK